MHVLHVKKNIPYTFAEIPVCEIMWNFMVQTDRPQATI